MCVRWFATRLVRRRGAPGSRAVKFLPLVSIWGSAANRRNVPVINIFDGGITAKCHIKAEECHENLHAQRRDTKARFFLASLL
jgi:hypothetical protein